MSSEARAGGASFLEISEATRALEEARQLGQRAVYLAERLPLMSTWQVELGLAKLAVAPEFTRTVDGVANLRSALKELSAAVEALPPVIEKERKAALESVDEMMVRERGAWIGAIETQSATARSLLEETRGTLEQASPLVTDVKASIDSAKALVADATRTVKLLNAGLGSANDLADRIEDLAGRVQENGADLAQITATVAAVNRAVDGLNQSLQSAERLLGAAEADPFERLFRVGASLIVLFFALGLASAVAFRLIARRLPY